MAGNKLQSGRGQAQRAPAQAKGFAGLNGQFKFECELIQSGGALRLPPS